MSCDGATVGVAPVLDGSGRESIRQTPGGGHEWNETEQLPQIPGMEEEGPSHPGGGAGLPAQRAERGSADRNDQRHRDECRDRTVARKRAGPARRCRQRRPYVAVRPVSHPRGLRRGSPGHVLHHRVRRNDHGCDRGGRRNRDSERRARSGRARTAGAHRDRSVARDSEGQAALHRREGRHRRHSGASGQRRRLSGRQGARRQGAEQQRRAGNHVADHAARGEFDLGQRDPPGHR